MLKKGISLSDAQLDFVIKTALIVVSRSYAKVKFDPSPIVGLRELFKERFLPANPKNPKEIEDFVLEAVKMLCFEKTGFSIFAVNLIIKKLAPMLEERYLPLLGAPLNRSELIEMDYSVKSMSAINEGNYHEVIEFARKYAGGQGANLYEWELNAYN